MTCRPSDGPKGMTLVELRVQGVLPKRQIILQIVDLGGRQKQMPFLVWTWWRNERCESWCIIGSSKIVLIIRHHCDCHWHHHCQYQHQLRGKVKICIIWYVNYLRLKQRTTLCDFPTASDLSALRQTASWEGAALMFVSSMKPRKMMTTESKWTIYLVLDHVQ